MMDERTAAPLSQWAEREMALTPNSARALRGATATEFGRATRDAAPGEQSIVNEPHVPDEPDPSIAAILERAGRAIADTDRWSRCVFEVPVRV